MRIICNVLIFKYYIKNRALWSIPVFIKKMQVKIEKEQNTATGL